MQRGVASELAGGYFVFHDVLRLPVLDRYNPRRAQKRVVSQICALHMGLWDSVRDKRVWPVQQVLAE